MNILTKNWGKIDPHRIESYIKTGGYEVLRKAIREMTPVEVINEIKISGLRGRGGAGFLTGDKWEISAKTAANEKYFICNLDESEPGTYKDRMIAEKNPHQIIEGLLIGAFSIGAKKAYIYINGHYRQPSEILKIALKQALEKEFVGRGIMGSAIDIEVEIFEGAGAYICGEETALLNSMEGKRGEPRLKPPYPPVSGLFGKPTVINNAETLANIPYILRHGAKTFAQIGTKSSPGTKLFLLDGAVKNKGLFEVPFGTTVQELIYNSLYAGGMQSGKEFWFAQIGGASGRLMPAGKLDQPLFYPHTNSVGSRESHSENKIGVGVNGSGEYTLGCGSILVVDKTVDIKDLMLSWAGFFHRESCGKCVPCREGTFRLWEIARRLKNNDLREKDRENINDILWTLSNTTFCPLGNFAAVAWSDAVAMFSKEIFS